MSHVVCTELMIVLRSFNHKRNIPSVCSCHIKINILPGRPIAVALHSKRFSLLNNFRPIDVLLTHRHVFMTFITNFVYDSHGCQLLKTNKLVSNGC